MTYAAGTRVKYVNPTDSINNGMTGIVIDAELTIAGTDICVKVDDSVIAMNTGNYMPAGSVCESYARLWTPIVPDGSIPSQFSFSEIMEDLKLQMMA